MPAPDDSRRPARGGPPAWLMAAPWIACGLVSTTQSYLLYPPKDGAEPWLLASMAVQMPPWLLLAAVAPLIARLSLRRRLTRARWRRSLPIHLGANALLLLGHAGVVVAVNVASNDAFFTERTLLESFGRIAVKLLLIDLFAYWLIVALVHAHALGREARERALAAANLEGALAEARLEALKVQLHPHFLFNTLHAIGVLVRKGEAEGALRMLGGLGELLRIALERTARPRVSLKEELDFAERYLAIEAVRLGDRLEVRRSIPGELLGVEVPALLLQPLVENAIRHGIAPRARGGTIAIAARRQGERLVLEVRDDGVGLAEGFQLERATGIGLRNIRDRLGFLHGGEHELTIEAAEGGGTVVRVDLPIVAAEAS